MCIVQCLFFFFKIMQQLSFEVLHIYGEIFFPEMCNTSYLNAFFSSSKIKQRLYLIPPSCAFLAECGDCEAARDAAQVQPPWVWVNKVDVVAPKRRRGTRGYLCLCFIFSLSQANFYQEKFAQLIEAEVDRRLEAESELRIERERQVRLGTHLHPLLN